MKIMKKILWVFLPLFVGYSCNYETGELVGSSTYNPGWYSKLPYGMMFIEQGSFNMGPSEQEVSYSFTAQTKTISVAPFYMDQTEITNDEYKQYTDWVRDSISFKTLMEEVDEEIYGITVDEYGDDLDPPLINWYSRINYSDPEVREALSALYYNESESFMGKKQIDVRKLYYDYIWIDLHRAALRSSRDSEDHSFATDRSIFIMKESVNVYPDTLCWVADFTYSYNDPMTETYNWHPAYSDYPVVGISWEQANAFCAWRTELLSDYLNSIGRPSINKFRLPTETEWEYAARGGLDGSPYPWGGPYIRNQKGCLLANFKPNRGNYIADGGFYTLKVWSYNPNDYGLYCMAGNVAEWTSNAFDESSYNFSHDLNPDYHYSAKEDDPPAQKRKSIRGGSWKDISHYLQTGTRTYEYQDSVKSYIGFRCVTSFLGRSQADNL